MQGDREGFLQLLYAIILVQFVVIVILVGGFSSEYTSNFYFHSWVNNSHPWLAPLLQGQIDALLVGIAMGGTVLLIRHFQGLLSVQRVIKSLIEIPPREPNVATGPVATSGVQVASDAPEDVLAELERLDTM